ncbi:hypothetical protein RJ639_042788 [Escallonia herrerae]|uniref:Gnk2-homologous domain-containing protein n=1 Tax=Escallonia herrerae TaxID=1293975 RepID=A0AA88WC44_9ASTE|nr:hypothetical protein RJ639_042788 [Escallonia herrerae]
METLPSGYKTNPKNASNMSQFNKALTAFFDKLRGEAARGDSVHKFATGYTTSTITGNVTIYALMQCTPD